ncbi:hypothetical protein LEP1GSC137_2596 [Leptospira borgpetersenii str. Noumea 25]|uniref:Uncharacterized protein n=1 Tax=Leptospira borgpetersenii serovar Ballum TaxID=280505 RepID=A0A0S2IUX0_LEPBO|nr:hypothetical protein LBBP_03254 [Leptospira borgpetersenii serovar Ballum]EKQ99830.1 hypothetical protein LEP1GSC121_2050 [Leptospira borgpetersenii serovar Castellonis str. 200801910]EMO09003.1 hypothetical protein LEP1GSC137_2596 [Leptospira borgpetersenii str. Noumea 25]OOV43734.1 hypothetical protein B1H38_11930 [Leptospira borgpetersenii serovar Ballum]
MLSFFISYQKSFFYGKRFRYKNYEPRKNHPSCRWIDIYSGFSSQTKNFILVRFFKNVDWILYRLTVMRVKTSLKGKAD